MAHPEMSCRSADPLSDQGRESINTKRDILHSEDSSDGRPDAELIRRIRRGDDAAFECLVDRHGERMLRVAMAMLGNAADAEDVVQETFAAAVRGLSGFRGDSSARTWLTRILVKRIARLRRSQRVRRAHSIDQIGEEPASAPGRSCPEADRSDVRMDLATVLAELSEEHRSVVVLRELHGMSYQEIAGVLGVPQGTVESRLSRARGRLRELLKGYFP